MLCSLRCYASRGKTSNNCKKHRRSEEIKVNLEKKRLADGSDGFGKKGKDIADRDIFSVCCCCSVMYLVCRKLQYMYYFISKQRGKFLHYVLCKVSEGNLPKV